MNPTTYYLLVYKYLSVFANRFDVISMPDSNIEFWPTAPPIRITDGVGQVQYQWPETVFFKLAEKVAGGQEQIDAVTQAVQMYNDDPDNAARQIPGSLQLVFTEEEAPGIAAIFESERQRLINLLP